MQQAAIDEIWAGKVVHVAHDGNVYEATGTWKIGDELHLMVRYFDGDEATPVPASECTALERDYENGDE